MTTTTLAARGRLLVTGTGEVLAADPAALIQQHRCSPTAPDEALPRFI